MNPNKQKPSELEELTLAYHEGVLTPEQAARLESLVLNDPQACTDFILRSSVATDLQWQFGAVNASAFPLRPPVSEGAASDQDAAATDEPAAASTAAAPIDAASAVDASGGALPMTPMPQTLSRSIQQHPLLYLAAGIVLIMSLWSATGLLSDRGNSVVIGSDSPFEFPRVVARLTRTLDAEWGVDDINNGAFLRSGQRLDLVGGLAEVTYKNGTVVLLEGPASFLLNDRDAEPTGRSSLKDRDGYLETGRISVRVPQGAHGFAVETAVATIMDMGAEFGLAVNADDAVSLLVFSGSAEMQVGRKFGEWRQRVDSGCSIRFDPRELSHVPQTVEEAGPFVRKLPEELPQLMLHWDFNVAADDGKLMLDRSGQGRHGRFVGNAGHVHLVPGPPGFGQAIALNGVEEFVELAEPQWSRLDDSFEEFTVAMWVNPSETRPLEVMLCGKMGWRLGRGWQLSLTAENKPRLVFFRAASDENEIALVGDKPLPVGEFSHLTMTFKGRESARLYLNGDLIGTLTDVPMRMNGANRVNLQVGNRGDGMTGRFFEGSIDDLRIYRVALSGTMVRRLIHIHDEKPYSADTERGSGTDGTHR